MPHWHHVDTGAHKCAKKVPSVTGKLELTGLDVSYYVKAVEKLVIT